MIPSKGSFAGLYRCTGLRVITAKAKDSVEVVDKVQLNVGSHRLK
jgi:hypothetical protein